MNIRDEKLSKEIYIILRRIWVSELSESFYPLIGINHIKIGKSLSTIVVYLDLELLKNEYKKEEILLKLGKLSPFLKHRLIERLNLPTHFKLLFEEDLFIQKARRVEDLINSTSQ